MDQKDKILKGAAKSREGREREHEFDSNLTPTIDVRKISPG